MQIEAAMKYTFFFFFNYQILGIFPQEVARNSIKLYFQKYYSWFIKMMKKDTAIKCMHLSKPGIWENFLIHVILLLPITKY